MAVDISTLGKDGNLGKIKISVLYKAGSHYVPPTVIPMEGSTCQRLIRCVESLCQRQLVNLTASDLCLGHSSLVSGFSLLERMTAVWHSAYSPFYHTGSREIHIL